MDLIQILDCNTTLNNCCSSYALVNVLDITRKIFSVIQLIAPILLILMTTIQFAQLTINPELKDGFRRILNKVIAAFILFLLPTLVDAVMGLVPDSFTISSCWNSAKRMAEVERGEVKFVETNDDASDGFYIPTQDVNNVLYYSPMAVIERNSPNAKVVTYAKQFVGQGYEYKGSWNGNPPYKKTDCSGFIRGVYLHYGVDLPHGCHSMINSSNTYKISKSEIQAGDIVVYTNHCAMLTGNGKEIIHARSERLGISITKDYTYKKIDAILRVKGVK